MAATKTAKNGAIIIGIDEHEMDEREVKMGERSEKIVASNMNTITPFPTVIISIFVASVYGSGTCFFIYHL